MNLAARSAGRAMLAFVVWNVLLGGIVSAAYYGVELRRWVWHATDSVRFYGDVRNGYRQGMTVGDVAVARAADLKRPPNGEDLYYAYLDKYSRAVPVHDTGRGGALDYAPGRLLVMSLWAWHGRFLNPPVEVWDNDYDQTAPLLAVNTVAAAATAIGMVALVRHWRRRASGRSVWPAWGEPWVEVPAVLAGLAVWFNPALLVNAHVWPQWDSWLLPFFVWGLVLASKEKWLLAGLVGTLGAAFKGQILMVLPLLALWPLFQGRLLAVVRVLLGAALAFTLIGLPWLLYTPASRLWMIEIVLLAMACYVLVGLQRRFNWAATVALLMTIGWVAPRAVQNGTQLALTSGAALVLLIAVVPRWMNWRWLGPLAAGQFALAVFFAAVTLGGQFEWFYLSYLRPQGQYPRMSIGANNLPMLLDNAYGWDLNDVVTLPGLSPTPIRTVLIGVFVMAVLMSAIAVAFQARRRSPRILIAFATPWVWMFTVLPQMHERYLLWGAVMMAGAFGYSLGMGLLGVVVALLSVASMSGGTFDRDLTLVPWWTNVMQGADGSVWALMLLAVICLVVSLTPQNLQIRKEVAPVPWRLHKDLSFPTENPTDRGPWGLWSQGI